MDNCIMCLETNDDILSRITTLSSEWIEGKMQKIIEKHLWWWYLKPLSESSGLVVPWICRQCWQEVSKFHHFYVKIEKAHKYFQTCKFLKQIDKKEQKIAIVKYESDKSLEPEIELVREEQLINTVKNENLSINKYVNDAFDLLDIKTERCSTPNEFETVEEHVNNIVSLNEDIQIDADNESNDDDKKSTENTMEHKENKDNQHKIECCICNVSLTDHLNVRPDPNYFKCIPCSKSFATRRGFDMHLKTHKTHERTYNCDKCGKSYFEFSSFEHHELTHVPEIERNFTCSQCKKRFASDYIRRQDEDLTHAKKSNKICDICGKRYSHRFSFLRHMKKHSGIKPSIETCDICGAEFTTKSNLMRHKKTLHLEENLQEQICPYCSRVSPSLNAHRMHIKYSHTMQRKHACHLCNKAFKRPLELKEHLSTHTGEVLYTCAHCPRTFISNANMHKHRKNIHGKEWEESRLKKLNKTGGKTLLILVTIGNDVMTTKKFSQKLAV